MLAKMTTKNQLTLPKAITNVIGPTEYFEVQTKDGQIVLTPVRIQRAYAVRIKLAELDITEADVDCKDPQVTMGLRAVLNTNDEVGRRGAVPTTNEASLSQSSTPSLAHRRRGPVIARAVVRSACAPTQP
jgi:hypothetical protein